jgi:uncharacterized membrane protein YczE
MELDWDMLRRPTDPPPVLVRRFMQLFVGLFLYGMGIALIVRGELGVAPWDVLTQGIAKQTGLNFGLITIITSGVVLLLWIPIRQRPGFGTVMNALLVGPFADLGLWLIPPGLDLWVRALLLPAGIEVVVLAAGWLLGGNVGIGTLAFAVLIGPLCGYTIPLFAIRRSERMPADRVPARRGRTRRPAGTATGSVATITPGN